MPRSAAVQITIEEQSVEEQDGVETSSGSRTAFQCKGKRGSIDSQRPPVLGWLNIEPDHWGYLINHFESRFKSLVGTAFKLKQVAQSLGYQRTPDIRSCEYYFS